MAESQDNQAGGTHQNVILTRVGDDAVIRPLENVSIEDVKQYVDAERKRTRRALIWTSTVLFCIFLFFTLIFLSLGLYLVRRNQPVIASVHDARALSVDLAQQVVAVSNRVSGFGVAIDSIDDRFNWLENGQTSIHQEYDAMSVDMDRIKSALSGTDARISEQFKQVSTDIRGAEERFVSELDELRKEFTDAILALSVTPAGVTTSPGSDAPPGAEPVADTGTDPEGEVAGEDGLVSFSPGLADMTNAADFGESIVMPVPEYDEEDEVRVLNFPNGDRYEGLVVNGLLHGWGVYYYQNGDRYEGQFEYDMKQGMGTLVYASGDTYEGGFEGDVRSGRGRMSFVNGDRYLGDFGRDKPHGNGTMLYADGNRYSGQYAAGMPHGNGTMHFANGDRYLGEFAEGERSGRGTYVFSDGSRYVGEFEKGYRHGAGKYTYAGGEVYEGGFRMGKREGEGLYFLPNGQKMKGLWKQGELLRQLD